MQSKVYITEEKRTLHVLFSMVIQLQENEALAKKHNNYNVVS